MKSFRRRSILQHNTTGPLQVLKATADTILIREEGYQARYRQTVKNAPGMIQLIC